MSLEGWLVFAGFWVVFVTSPGPNAVNCIRNGLALGLPRALIGVTAILTQSALFLALSAAGISALILHAPGALLIAKLAGAAVLIWLGIRSWRAAERPLSGGDEGAGSVWLKAFLIATINPKSVAGYLAAFTQFVEPDLPISRQMWAIVPTSLLITATSYSGYTALGAWLGTRALGVVGQTRVRRLLAGCFLLYGLALGASALPFGEME
ncbi:LysE family translocator [Litorisediminicola beolgyonensis]|uniref:LysE family translocator n=1 Tax=Litorisediminicola beolgyonensis TaxID=1173614 RepID=A0ABW3ZLS9_9RHOB